jgi:hypothetical protein
MELRGYQELMELQVALVLQEVLPLLLVPECPFRISISLGLLQAVPLVLVEQVVLAVMLVRVDGVEMVVMVERGRMLVFQSLVGGAELVGMVA